MGQNDESRFLTNNLNNKMTKTDKSLRIVFALTVLLMAATGNAAKAQTFKEAQTLAFNGEREKARAVCWQLLHKGFNSDVALLLGRTYAWDSMYDSARVVLKEVLVHRAGNMEAYDALSDVEFWADNADKAVNYCDAALKAETDSYFFALKKARILASEERYDEAANTLETFLSENPGQADVLLKLTEYRQDALKNSLKLTYSLEVFDDEFNRDPWQLTALSYSRKTKFGSLIARMNYAERYGDNGIQFELDAYPSIAENSYLYLSYGFSADGLFPNNRYGIELYRNFSHGIEGSAGMRYLDFNSSGVDVYTATLGKYLGNYWFSIRTYITPGSNGTSVSGFLSARRYFADAENYIGLKVGYGVSPDDSRNQLGSQANLSLNKRSAGIEYNHIFNKKWILNTSATWNNEELVPGAYSNYYSFNIGLSRMF